MNNGENIRLNRLKNKLPLIAFIVCLLALIMGFCLYRFVCPPATKGVREPAKALAIHGITDAAIKDTIAHYVIKHGVSPRADAINILLGSPRNGEGAAIVVPAQVEYDDAANQHHSGSGEYRYYPDVEASEFVNYHEAHPQ